MNGRAEMDTMRMKAVLVLVAAIAFATAPLWSGGFAGFRPDQFPVPQDDPPVQPAGYAFSIWLVIYLWLVVSAGYGLLRRAEAADWDAPRWPAIVSLAVGAIWLSVAAVSPVWALVLIWVMLVTALIAAFRAPEREPWLARYPFELYAGWLTAASCVSLGLNGAGFGIGPGEVGWANLSLAAAVVVAGGVLRTTYAPVYAAGVVWALLAVIAANWRTTPSVAIAAGLGAVVVVGFAVLSRGSGRPVR